MVLLDFLKTLKAFFAKLLDKWKGLPTASKILFGGTLVSIIVVIVVMAVVLAAPGYVPLVSGLTEEQAGYIVQQLDAMGVKYRVEPGRILISKRYNVYELRMRLASAGILGPMTRGFEILDQQSLGATSFDRQVRYQIALQGELERSIMTISGVKSARVHLTLPKYTYYVRGEMVEPRASVLVVLEPGKDLSQTQIKGIMQLVAGAVEGLKLENVRVIDQYSRVLSDRVTSSAEMLVAADRTELKMNLESYYAKKIKQTLEAVFGAGRVEVIPDIKLDWEKVERQITKYEPITRQGGLIRSQEQESEKSVNMPTTGGPVGTEANIPPTYPSLTPQGTATYERTRTITNYELSSIVENLVQNKEGEIRSVSLSVIIDASSSVFNGFSETEMNKWATIVSDLVEKGIGASSSEQNLSVSVAFLPFDRSLEEEFRKSQLELEQRRRYTTMMLGLSLLAGLSFLLIYLIILQVRRAKARKAIEARKVRMEEELKRMLEEEKTKEVPLSPEEKALQELRENLEKVFKEDPEEVASVIKLWLVERGT
ncbi:MAG: Flagellar M-ring protein [Thermotoga sp. 50_1627]|uniref:flagellar basal-body MS-ring/collar protein FliF n=1 Tax=Pseudothermotoga sp. TaxID=2033661 RepID=UPI00076C21D5|nr:MAG: Flagellar M-ring protein [Thermotoga sp. 50_64]KUK24911.1 MAG: Flagellar M-ring protein [Thermotoga sp. 50_1627]MDK2923312.1 flagellar M-ring protein FliF [Pseudothermotoga sp.]